MTRFKTIAALAGALVLAAAATTAAAQTPTRIRFQLDWRFEGPSALFLLPRRRATSRRRSSTSTIDAGSGSGNAVNRVASGTYQMGFADLAALIEFVGNNPTAPNKPVAVMMVYDTTPAAVLSLKKTGIKTPADLHGKKMGAPVFDAGRRAFPIFVKANKLDSSKIAWTAMDPPLRETMLARGDVDAITGFYFTSLLNLNARGVKDEDIDVLMYPKYGVNLYGNAIIVSEQFLKEQPGGGARLPARVHARACATCSPIPTASIKYVKERDALIDETLEKRRMKLAIESVDRDADGEGERHRRRDGRRLERHGDAGGLGVRPQEPGQARADLQRRASCRPRRSGWCSRSSRLAPSEAPAAGQGLPVVRTRHPPRSTRAKWLSRSSTSVASALAYDGQDGVRGRGHHAVDPAGEFVAIVGPSGCGKSTFMKLATGLQAADAAATVVVDGARGRPGRSRSSAWRSRRPTLLPWRTTLDNVLLPLEIVEPYRSTFKRDRAQFAERARALLADRRPRRLRGQVSVAALRRHAAARVDLPRARPPAEDAAARRAVRRARRVHARGAVVRAARPVAGSSASR